jgi:protein Mpv17
MMTLRLVLVLALSAHHAAGFGIMPSHETVNLMQQAATHFMHQAPQHQEHLAAHLPNFLNKLVHHTPPPPPPHDLAHILRQAPQELLHKYTTALAEHALPTKMATGATLAVAGDAIAQQASSDSDEYDTKRAASFALFDSAYRALQHVAFPIIVATCHGQFLSGLLPDASSNLAAAMEQTLASQLGIVPFLYYPIFFAFSGAVQGLDADEAWTRAKENFLPLMQRNLLFWIPVQFIQFAFIQEDLQIPFLSVCGLAWTFILSISAGSAKGYSASADAAQQGMPTAEQLAPPPDIEMMTADDQEVELEKLALAESPVQ